MTDDRLDVRLRGLRVTAAVVSVVALCLAVALAVVALVPGSPVVQVLPASALAGATPPGTVAAGVAVDPAGWVPFSVHDASLVQRLLHLLTEFPGIVLIALVARRVARLLHAARAGDPFTPGTAATLVSVGTLVAVGGAGTWLLSQVAQAALTRTMLAGDRVFTPHDSPLGWVAAGLVVVAVGRIVGRGVALRAELDTVI